MNPITLYQPQKIVFGAGTIEQLPEECKLTGCQKVLIISIPPMSEVVEKLMKSLKSAKIDSESIEYRMGEPTFEYFNFLLNIAKAYSPDCVIGIGGGSVLDTAKLIAALHDNVQSLNEVLGKNILSGRDCRLICIPTTSGTGSEVSPNAILLDEETDEKKSVISPFLIPDSCYVDPELTMGLPPKITAETAMDALSHCIESYTNKHSHPAVDIYALAGIKLITANLEDAYNNGNDINARAALALGSMYGGLCLGPVNTAAVHALSYGLGGKYHISHGLANAILLPEVMKFNFEATPEKYTVIAQAMGLNTASEAIERIREIAANCGIPQKLQDIGINPDDVETLADLAMKVTRLLVNNPKELTREDAINIYNSLF